MQLKMNIINAKENEKNEDSIENENGKGMARKKANKNADDKSLPVMYARFSRSINNNFDDAEVMIQI